VLYRAGEAASVWASATRGSWELPASAAYSVNEAVRLCGLRRLRGVAALRLFRDAYENCGGLQNKKRPPTLVVSKPSTRRGVHIRAASSTQLKPPLNSRCRGTASRAFAAENNTYTNPVLENKQTFDTAQRTSNLKTPAKATPKNK
jgi:hypothetical protein